MRSLTNYANAVRSFTPNARRFLVMTALLGIGTAFQWLFFNLYVLALGYDQSFVGLLASIPAWATVLSALPIGLILPRLGYRRGLLAASALYVTAFVGWAAFPTAGILLSGSALVGIAAALLMITTSPLMVAISKPTHRTQLFGVQFGLNTLVGVVANLAGGFLPRLFASAFDMGVESPLAYRAVLLVAMALTACTLIPIARMRSMRAGREDRTVGFRDVGEHRRTFLKLLVVQLTVALGAGMLMPFVNVFYKLRFELADPAIGTIFSLSSLLTGLSAFLSPILAGRMGKIRMVVATQALSLPFLVAMGFSPWLELSIVGFLVRTALMNMSAPVFSAFTMGIVPSRLRPMTATLFALAWNAGWAISSRVSGGIQVAVGFWPLFVITGIFYVVSIALTYALFRRTQELADQGIMEELHVDEDERV